MPPKYSVMQGAAVDPLLWQVSRDKQFVSCTKYQMIDFLIVGIGYALYMALLQWLTGGEVRLRVFDCVCCLFGAVGFFIAELRQMDAFSYVCVLIVITSLVDLVTGDKRDN